jgi:hypothetical protein
MQYCTFNDNKIILHMLYKKRKKEWDVMNPQHGKERGIKGIRGDTKIFYYFIDKHKLLTLLN